MRHRILPWIAAAVLLSTAGCGSDNDDDEQAATATTPAREQTTTTTESGPRSTTTTAGGAGVELSADGRAVLAATQDLAADVSETAEQYAEGRIDDDEAMARLEIAGERAADLRDRARELPAADRARSRLAALNDSISHTADELATLVASGRTASRDQIEERIDELHDDARSAFDAVREQLDERAQERFREALERIGAG